MRLVFTISFWLLATHLFAQDDLLDQLEQENPLRDIRTATFKSTRVINSHSVETLKHGQLDFRISHRFGAIGSGAYELWGLDQATIRIGLEYGVSDEIDIGLGRSSFMKTFDCYLKARLFQQREGAMPATVTWFSNMASYTAQTSDAYVQVHPVARASYTHQLLIARKLSSSVSLQVAPVLVHYNYARKNEENDLYAVQFGGRFKISKRLSVNLDYIHRIGHHTASPYHNMIATGLDIETGGHVFQLHITNAQGMTEQYFIGRTTGAIVNGDIFYGFNISRQFNLTRKRTARASY